MITICKIKLHFVYNIVVHVLTKLHRFNFNFNYIFPNIASPLFLRTTVNRYKNNKIYLKNILADNRNS